MTNTQNYNNPALAEAAKKIGTLFDIDFVTFEGKTYLTEINADNYWGYAGLPYTDAQQAVSNLILILEKGEIEEFDYVDGFLPDLFGNPDPSPRRKVRGRNRRGNRSSISPPGSRRLPPLPLHQGNARRGRRISREIPQRGNRRKIRLLHRIVPPSNSPIR